VITNRYQGNDSNTGIEDAQGNIIIDQTQVLIICENYVTELYDRANGPESLEVKTEEEKCPYILHIEV
jgi:hypothetical protein